MITIKDVAALAEVSMMTVSRYFNHPDQVSQSTREKIESVCEKVGYVHSSRSVTLPLENANLLGVVVPDSGNPYFAETFKEINNQAMAKGFQCILIDTGNCKEREMIAIKRLLSYKVKGIFLSPIFENENYKPAYLTQLASSGVKVVFIEQIIQGTDYPLVEFDNASNAYDLTKLAVSMDSRKQFLILAGSAHSSVSNERLRGVESFLKSVQIYNYDVVQIDFNSRATKKRCIELFDTKRYSSILALNNLIAKGAIQALNHHGLNSMVFSFDLIPGADIFGYSIPYVKHDYQEVGSSAFKIMDAMLHSTGSYAQRTLIEGDIERAFSSRL
ncbi:LacI family DNA-binding transcriptional regulator [Vibrio panuliri]|uniref:Autoinducer 2-binding periplasmic protein LuxP n=1 Tax=Vibrio panuliri TaxID=1381081 RepID=A0A1Q9HJT1_9VIBR|nr:LacI family DNA-binding transcriptional regulator [Vibrio panuliri]KAB1453859.1 LacI family transcriptional regulator [Vibrio panuliri]OLQ90592.1 hypothetical protein BIY22_06255 [Vibrio panuliri]OLQ96282.1 hypothetical protein BIY20_19500 [Vibrio panuliri]